MSLYSMLFGTNPATPLLLAMVGVGMDDYPIPRFRDTYLKKSDHHGWMLGVHTRTGGGNRTCYCRDRFYHSEEEIAELPEGEHRDGCYPAMNKRLTEHPLYLYDADDDFDRTYATFWFRLPERFHPVAESLIAAQPDKTPREKWERLFRALEGAGDGEEPTPEVERALEVGRTMLSKINDALAENGEARIEV